RRVRPRGGRRTARPRPWHAELQRPAEGIRPRAREVVHRDHRPVGRSIPDERPVDRDPHDPIDDPDSLSSRCGTRRAPSSDSGATAHRRTPLRASARRRWRRACARSTATSTRSPRSSGWCPSSTCPAPFRPAAARDLEEAVHGLPAHARRPDQARRRHHGAAERVQGELRRRRYVSRLAEIDRAARAFERVAAEYEGGRPGYAANVVADAIAELDLGPGSTVLDLGAGTGKLTRMLLDAELAVIAIDPSPAMLAQLRAAAPAAQAAVGAAEAVPLPGES